jgi:NitT/TauT family transport system substrate-binding protein
MMKKNEWRVIVLSGLIITMIGLTGCTKKVSQVGVEEKIKFDILYKPFSFTTVITVLAEDAGYYSEYGLDTTLHAFNGSSVDEANAVSTQKLNVSTSSGPVVPLEYIEQGNDIIIIGGVMSRSGAMIVRPENYEKYKTLTTEVLSGAKIGYVRTTATDVAMRGGLIKNGVDISKIEFVQIDSNPNMMEAVRKGLIDIGSCQTIFRSVAEEQGFVILKHLDELLPDYVCCRIYTTKRQLDENRERFVRFLKANIKAYKLYLNEPERSLQIAKKYYDIEEDVLKNQLYDYGHISFHPDPLKFRVLESYDQLVSIDYAQGGADIEAHIDTSLYAEALDEILAEFPDDRIYLEMKKYFEVNN